MEWRTLALAVAVFTGTFAGGWWLGVGKWVPTMHFFGVRPVAAVTVVDQPAGPPGKGLTDDDALRQAVILRARAYQRPQCNQDAKTLYVQAASGYAELLMRAAGCNNGPRCFVAFDALDRIWRANRSASDIDVADAMAAAHKAGGLSERSFRGDIGRTLMVITRVEFEEGPPPACVMASSGTSGNRVRERH